MHQVWPSLMSLSGRRGRGARHYSEILKFRYLGMKKLFHIWCGRKLDELVAGGWGCFVPLFAVLLARWPPVVVSRACPGLLLT